MTSPARFDTITPVATRLWFASFGVTVLIVAACGARSELDGEFRAPDVPDAGPDVRDAAPDLEDAPFDAPPPTCDDAGITYIYVVSAQNTLFSYYPPSGVLSQIGTIKCTTSGATPFSMGVDRGGTAYVVFSDGQLFRVSTATAACKATSFAVGQKGFTTFGMGFSSNTANMGETLFVAESPDMGTFSLGLGSIDTMSLKLSFVGPFSPPIGRTEFTGTGDGRLFGFSIDEPGPGSHLSEIDQKTGKILSSTPLALGDQSSAFAYAYWGGAFYFFIASGGGGTTVTRYNPADKSLVNVSSNPQTIVGAGVSTCAPH